MALVAFATFSLEAIGGMEANSLTLPSDSFHVLMDFIAIGTAIAVEYWVRDKDGKSIAAIRGWGGIVSSFFLFATLIPIVRQAVLRLRAPEDIHPATMILFAAAGFVGNGACFFLLRGSHECHVTHTSMVAHVISDLAQSAGVVAAGVIILCTGWEPVDSLLTFVITVLLLRIFWKTFRQGIGTLRAYV